MSSPIQAGNEAGSALCREANDMSGRPLCSGQCAFHPARGPLSAVRVPVGPDAMRRGAWADCAGKRKSLRSSGFRPRLSEAGRTGRRHGWSVPGFLLRFERRDQDAVFPHLIQRKTA